MFKFLRRFGWFNWLRFRTWERHHVLKMRYLEPGWHDKDQILLHSMFEILCRFIEDEKAGEIVDWNNDEIHKDAWKEMNDLYNWWEERQNRDKQNPILQPDLKHPEMKFTPLNDGSDCSSMEFVHESPEDKVKWEKVCDDCSEWELKCEKEDEEMMIRLIKVRSFMWT